MRNARYTGVSSSIVRTRADVGMMLYAVNSLKKSTTECSRCESYKLSSVKLEFRDRSKSSSYWVSCYIYDRTWSGRHKFVCRMPYKYILL